MRRLALTLIAITVAAGVAVLAIVAAWLTLRPLTFALVAAAFIAYGTFTVWFTR